jgi:MSHA biogenesis protein MshQ
LFQYWSGSTWVLNGDDSCTVIPSGAVIFARYISNQGVASETPWGSVSASGITASSGRGNISLSAPAAGSTGSIELAVNLGDTATDASCLSAHPAGGKAQQVWLRGPHGGACVGAGPFDPSARATIGVFAPESRRVMHSQDMY